MTPSSSKAGTWGARAARNASILWRVTASAVLLLALAEFTARVARPSRQRSVQARTAAEEGVPYTLHPFLQMVNPAAEDIDAGPDFAGFRLDPPDTTRDDGRLRVLFLGGSTMANEFPHQVRALLEPELGPVAVYNLSYDWYTALHSLYQWWTYADLIEPDLVVVLHNVNDFARGFTPPAFSLPQYREDYSHHAGALAMFWTVGAAEFEGRPTFDAPTRSAITRRRYTRPLRGVAQLLREESALFRAVLGPETTRGERLANWRAGYSDDGDVVRAPMPDEQLLRALPAFERHMTNLRDCALDRGVPTLLLTMPWCAQTPHRQFLATNGLLTNDGRSFMTPDDFARGMRRFNDVVLELGSAKGASSLDLAAQLRDCGMFKDEVHLTPEGLELEARLVSDFIVEAKLLTRR